MKTGFLKRKADAHKGDFGHVFILAGSRGFTGAAHLCAQAGLRSGAGLVTLGIPESLSLILATKLTEAMTLVLPETKPGSLSEKAFKDIAAFAEKSDILAIGPGLSRNPQTQKLIRKCVQQIKKPMVIDADGLNALVGNLDILKKRKFPTVITPHPGEMARLLGVSVEKVQKNRTGLAKELSCRYNMVTVLKGNQTVVSSERGELYLNNTGNPGMAKAGCGDVLTGVIAAFLGQGQDAFEAAKLAVHVHGLAADLAIKNIACVSLLASDILDKLPLALKEL